MTAKIDNIAEHTDAGWTDGWRPIETAPRDGTEILVCMWDDHTMMVVNYEADPARPGHPWWTLDGQAYAEGAPTHWMPLPAPPSL